MKISTHRILRQLVVGCSLGALSFGCGATAEGEFDQEELSQEELDALTELGTLEQGLTAACGTFAAQATFTGRVSGGGVNVSVAQQGAGCHQNSYIFDINDYNVGFNPLYTPRLVPQSIPTNQADCEATELRYYVWDKTTSPPTFLDLGNKYGVWQNDPPFFVGCDLSRSSPVSLTGGKDYRFGVLARKNGVARAFTVLHETQIQ